MVDNSEKKKLNALIVEDEQVALAKIKLIMDSIGSYQIAETGDSCLQQFSSSLSSRKYFDVLLIDIGLPDMSGKGLLKKIDELEEKYNVPSDKKVKKIMVTASAEKQDLFGSIQDRCDDYLLKPVTKDIVMDKLKAVGLL